MSRDTSTSRAAASSRSALASCSVRRNVTRTSRDCTRASGLRSTSLPEEPREQRDRREDERARDDKIEEVAGLAAQHQAAATPLRASALMNAASLSRQGWDFTLRLSTMLTSAALWAVARAARFCEDPMR